MRRLTEKLRSFLAADAGVAAIVGSRIHASHIPQTTPLPAIWLGRRSTDDLAACLDDPVGAEPISETFDVEAIGDGYASQDGLVDAIHACLHNYRGEWGGVRIQGVIVRDHSDDYVPRSNSSGAGFYLGGVSVEIFAGPGA
jgi:hypothetical protein